VSSTSKTLAQGKVEVAKLCQYFETNRKEFLASGVKEAHVRQSLIDPFFEALGWDVRNSARVAPQYREVIPEDSLDVEGHQKAPDYTFRVGTLPKFYAEAKRCGVDISTDPSAAYQLRRYGWSARVPLSILTDFEELGVYDCTLRPAASNKASHARIQYFRFDEYPDRWQELWDVFSRESVWSGAFDQYAASKRKRGTSEVDVEFLKEIEGWRDALARNIALRNKQLSSDDLNTVVQRTIDRIVFLRMAEDRGIEPYEQLSKLCEQPEVYSRFMRDLCRRANEKYNSGLFHFQKERGISEIPDRTSPTLKVDDKVFRAILQSLYFANGSPYHFGVFPVEILGTVYERFLGKVIRLTTGHQARVEEKPEVRKAEGVYYTPAYIVEHIVKHTVGREIEGRSPAQLAGRKGKQPFRVLDMACGSGSFLLGAYQCLLNHCLRWYTEHRPERHKRAVYQDSQDGEWRLTIDEKKRILTAHVFGVDIDPQAVEVSKLSLLLKALEGENDVSLSWQLALFHDRALPNLSDNIKCGNSLIGPDYFTDKMIPDPDEAKRVNAFDWKEGFPEAVKAGGFDCIIGNPPYIRIQRMKEWAPLEVEAYKDLFRAGRTGNYDIYVVFVEKGLQMLNARGRLGFICPHKFFNAKYGEPLRRMLAEGRHLEHVVHFGHQQVFGKATTYTCLLFLSNTPVSDCMVVKVDDLAAWRTAGTAVEGRVKTSQVKSGPWNFVVGPGAGLYAKLSAMHHKMGDVVDIFVGLQTSADDVYIMDFDAETPRTYSMRSKALAKDWTFEKDLLYPIVSGTDVGRYGPLPNRQYVLFPYTIKDGRATLISFKTLKCDFPKTAAYLAENKRRLEGRERGRMKGPDWHGYIYLKNMTRQSVVKLCVPRLVEHLHAAFDFDGSHFLDNVDVGGVTLKAAHASLGLEYILVLMNSRLMRWYFPKVSAPFRGGWRSANRQFLSLLPVRLIDFNNAKDKAVHGEIVRLAESMQVLHRQLAAGESAAHKERVRRQIVAIDAHIDRLVYDLYGLTQEEIAIVERTSAEASGTT
jgi:SAM-dependent methyltransferase